MPTPVLLPFVRNYSALFMLLGKITLVVTCCPLAAYADDRLDLPRLIADDFETSSDRWETTDPTPAESVWMRLFLPRAGRANHVLRVTGPSSYQPPQRSPHSIALLKEFTVTDFDMVVAAQSTNRLVGEHRDLCLFWGYQDSQHFYYVHLGAKSDPHSCQIFIVNGAPRTKITTHESPGIPWTDSWHTVRVTRSTSDGRMAVYFDDLTSPVMVANDNTFRWGRVGLGTFDDHGNFDNFSLRGSRRD